jgi:hypothetical protein
MNALPSSVPQCLSGFTVPAARAVDSPLNHGDTEAQRRGEDKDSSSVPQCLCGFTVPA